MFDWSNWPAAKDVLLFVIAVYGALLSTFNWRAATRKEKRLLKVDMSTTVPVYGAELGKTFVTATAANIGQRPIVISHFAFELPDGRNLTSLGRFRNPEGLEDTQLPVTLADGQTARVSMRYEDVARAAYGEFKTPSFKLYVCATDSAGNRYRSAPWTVDAKEWAAM